MKISRLNFYSSFRGVSAEAEANGEYCRISDLPKEIQDEHFEPKVRNRAITDDDCDDEL